MGQALYRSNRPRSFNDVVGQDHIVKTLKNSLKSGKFSHAYLFTGPRGVGKTSVARILAHEVNSLDYHEDNVHLDIIEIDAASNRRIDEIRDLRDKVHIAPAAAKYKVYIIDEVHMLTREAFNALLKTLEEPPAHCIFILATTEAHKVPETISSRTQKFTFRPIDNQQAADHLEQIAKTEKIDISREAIELLALHGGGSFRDSISLLDQMASSKQKIGTKEVSEMLGLAPEELIESILDAVKNTDKAKLLMLLDDARDQAVEPSVLAASISQKLRSRLKTPEGSSNELNLLRSLVEVSGSNQPAASLEIALLKAVLDSESTVKNRQVPLSPKNVELKATSSPVIQEKPVAKKVEELLTEAQTPTPKSSGKFTIDDWPKIISKVKDEAASLYTALRLATPNLENDKLILSFRFPLHQKKVESAKAKDIIGKFIEEQSGTKLAIEAIVDKSIPDTTAVAIAEPEPIPVIDEQTQNISNIFGGAELLKS